MAPSFPLLRKVRRVYCPVCVKEWTVRRSQAATCGEHVTDLEVDPSGQTKVWSSHDLFLLIVD